MARDTKKNRFKQAGTKTYQKTISEQLETEEIENSTPVADIESSIIKDEAQEDVVSTEQSSSDNSSVDVEPKEGKKRGRKPGTVLVKEKDKKRNISISVSPEKEKIYKKIIKNDARYSSMSQLVELALDEFIKANNLN